MASVIFPTICVYQLLIVVFATEIQPDRVEVSESMYRENLYKFTEARVTKINRTTFTVNYEFVLFFDIDQNIEMDATLYFNRLNNNQYTRTPYGMKKESFCKLLDKYYYTFLKDSLKECTNYLDYVNETNPLPICPVPVRVCFDFCSNKNKTVQYLDIFTFLIDF